MAGDQAKRASANVPTEIWQKIIRLVLYWPGFMDIDDDAVDQPAFEKEFRFDVDKVHILRDKERQRRHLRVVCKSWCEFVDRVTGGWLYLNPVRTSLLDQMTKASRVDYYGHKSSVSDPRLLLRKLGNDTRILTIYAPTASIDTSILTYRGPLSNVQALDLRPASTFLYTNRGVGAFSDFFPHLATLFPNLSVLLVEVPAFGSSDILAFPKLKRLSYRVIGQSRISDDIRCLKLEEWKLPGLKHLYMEPVACEKDWRLLLAGLAKWGAELRSLSWEASYPDKDGIRIGRDDWESCRRLEKVLCDHSVVHGEVSSYDSRAPTRTPHSHPFHHLIHPSGTSVFARL